jgi:hypothetical protein
MSQLASFFVHAAALIPTLAALAALCHSPLAVAQPAPAPVQEVDIGEVLRRGDHVEHVDGYGADDAVGAVFAKPNADAAKWFVSLVKLPGCIPCERLLDAWSQEEKLLAFADPKSPAKSWAHFNSYDLKDPTQAFRFEKLRITVVPTILVQPPRDGSWGDPGTIVAQIQYGGDPKALAGQLSDAIRRYCVAYRKARHDAPQIRQQQGTDVPRGDRSPPWVTPDARNPNCPDGRCPIDFDRFDRPNTDPTVPPPTTPWAALAGYACAGFTLLFFGAVGVLLLVMFLRRQSTPAPTQFSPAQIAALKAALK